MPRYAMPCHAKLVCPAMLCGILCCGRTIEDIGRIKIVTARASEPLHSPSHHVALSPSHSHPLTLPPPRSLALSHCRSLSLAGGCWMPGGWRVDNFNLVYCREREQCKRAVFQNVGRGPSKRSPWHIKTYALAHRNVVLGLSKRRP